MKSKVQRLKDEAEKLWKECCFARDGRECQVKVNYPDLKIKHTNIMQVDHCIGRKCSELKFAVPNGSVICSSCNRMKHYQQKSVHRLVDEIVEKREGKELFNKMKQIDMRKGAFTEFSKVYWLEMTINNLKKKLEHLKTDYIGTRAVYVRED